MHQEDALDGVGDSEDDLDARIQHLRDQEDIDRDFADDGPDEQPAGAVAKTGDPGTSATTACCVATRRT